MHIFDPRNRQVEPELARRYALFEVVHTAVDFAAAFLFIIGSILFFFESTMIAGTYCFLFGSIFFAAKPAIRLAREFWLKRHDRVDHLAQMAPEAPADIQSLLSSANQEDTDEDSSGRSDDQEHPDDSEGSDEDRRRADSSDRGGGASTE